MIKLKELRKARGESIREMSERLDIPANTIAKWGQGIRKPKLEKIIHICKVYGISLAVLAPDLWEEIVGAVDTIDLKDELDRREDEAR